MLKSYLLVCCWPDVESTKHVFAKVVDLLGTLLWLYIW